jgi:tRNA threonylcarbamoyladenosine biosynthesis protein TsaE
MWLADEAATLAAGASLAPVVERGDVIALSGPLGAGKTAFSRGLITALGFAGEVPSPSFALVVPYDPPDTRLPIWHVDLYRLDDDADIDELGLDDARADALIIVEWPERLGARLWPDALQLAIAIDGDARRLTATVPPSWEHRWPLR